MLGGLALLLAAGAAFWALYRAGKPDAAKAGGQKRAVFALKLVVWLGVAAALLAAKLFPLALMVLLAAGGVTAIELWRDRAIGTDSAGAIPGAGPSRAPLTKAALAFEEAAAILGVDIGASADDIRAAHRKLIGQLHPDKGGTDYLAAKINDARRVMLERLGADTGA